MGGETLCLIARAQAGDEAALDTLVRENMGLVWSVARRYFGRGVEPEDLSQLGCVGLLKAIQGFNTEFGTQFSTYAVPKIAGEIRRFLRDDGPVKVSRGMKEQAQQVLAARNRLEQRLGRAPVLSELSEATGLRVEDIVLAETAAGPARSLQEEYGSEGCKLEDVLGDDGQEESLVERFALDEAVNSLPERERAVISLRYFHGLTQDRAAKILGISQVQVSRLEKRAVQNLRKIMV